MTRGKYAARAQNREHSELLAQVERLTSEVREAYAQTKAAEQIARLVPGLRADNERLKSDISLRVAPDVARLNEEIASLKKDHGNVVERVAVVVTNLLNALYELGGSPSLADQHVLDECLGLVAPSSAPRWYRRTSWSEGAVRRAVSESAGQQLSDGRKVAYAGRKIIAVRHGEPAGEVQAS